MGLKKKADGKDTSKTAETKGKGKEKRKGDNGGGTRTTVAAT